jgi:hypothetical protein
MARLDRFLLPALAALASPGGFAGEEPVVPEASEFRIAESEGHIGAGLGWAKAGDVPTTNHFSYGLEGAYRIVPSLFFAFGMNGTKVAPDYQLSHYLFGLGTRFGPLSLSALAGMQTLIYTPTVSSSVLGGGPVVKDSTDRFAYGVHAAVDIPLGVRVGPRAGLAIAPQVFWIHGAGLTTYYGAHLGVRIHLFPEVAAF